MQFLKNFLNLIVVAWNNKYTRRALIVYLHIFIISCTHHWAGRCRRHCRYYTVTAAQTYKYIVRAWLFVEFVSLNFVVFFFSLFNFRSRNTTSTHYSSQVFFSLTTSIYYYDYSVLVLFTRLIALIVRSSGCRFFFVKFISFHVRCGVTACDWFTFAVRCLSLLNLNFSFEPGRVCEYVYHTHAHIQPLLFNSNVKSPAREKKPTKFAIAINGEGERD